LSMSILEDRHLLRQQYKFTEALNKDEGMC